MNEIMSGEVLTMSSREIAELVNKQHSNIKISVERLAEKGVIGTLAPQEFNHNGNTYTEYLLNKRDSLVVVAQNSPEFTARLVDRWQELENRLKKPATQQPAAIGQRYPEDVLEGYMKACNVLAIPVHMAQVEAVKHVRIACGVDYSNLLKIAPAQQNLAIEDVYLEPTELGKKLGYTPMKMNLVLCNLGLQEKTGSGWEPTTAGKQICTIHQWANGSKSGVNLKWKVSAVRALAESYKG